MLLTTFAAVIGLVFLYFGGEWLVRGASAVAGRMGISQLAVGLTVVAFGTSAPEMAVSLDSALRGAHDIAVGNVVGSNIANIGLILGLAILLAPTVVQGRLWRVDGPLVLVASLLLVGALADGVASRVEGALLLAGLLLWVTLVFRQARNEPAPVRQELEGGAPVGPAWRPALLLVVVGLLLLIAGGQLLVRAAVALASAAGVSQATIGLSVVAVGTSLPELATSWIAASRGRGDIAVGNVVGSNLFNILGILGSCALVQSLGRGGIGAVDLGTMVGMAALLALFLLTRSRLERWEGAVLLAGYVAYMAWLLR